jgi:hypothetical protein
MPMCALKVDEGDASEHGLDTGDADADKLAIEGDISSGAVGCV